MHQLPVFNWQSPQFSLRATSTELSTRSSWEPETLIQVGLAVLAVGAFSLAIQELLRR